MRQPEPSELGQVLSRHRGRVLAGGWPLYLGLVFAASSITWVVVARWWEAVGCAAVAAVALLISWRRWDLSVTAYERGIVWNHGRQHKVVRWEEVANVAAESIGDAFLITVTTHDGSKLVLDDHLADVHQLHGYLINATRGRERPGPTSSAS